MSVPISEQPTPSHLDLPGAFPETPASLLETPGLHPRQSSGLINNASASSNSAIQGDASSMKRKSSSALGLPVAVGAASSTCGVHAATSSRSYSSTSGSSTETQDDVTVVGNGDHVGASKPKDLEKRDNINAAEGHEPREEPREIRPITKTTSRRSEAELFKALSRRRSSMNQAHMSRQQTNMDDEEDRDEIEQLMSRMFGQNRQEQSMDEQTRHRGVIFKNLTVKGSVLGVALQPSNGDLFMGPFRGLKKLFTKGPKALFGKTPTRTLLNDFTGCIKPGEMLLVLGRPGAGCSTFLKILGNQRYGYESIEGDVTYGGTDAEEMGKKYTSEVLYNPEDDLHYATLKVKETLKFALKTKTPGKEGRVEGESRSSYVQEFLRVVSKLFWIEHTMDTKVGNELVHGVSGGEKKRISISEAMITKASVQSWDNSTRGLDSSTALEYVQALRSLTNMAQISTSVALYQAGQTIFECFDKVLLIHEGECCYFGSADKAVQYFEGLGFNKPERWTSADFLTSVTDPKERQIKDGWEKRIPRSGAQFREALEKSDIFKSNQREVKEFERESHEQRQSAPKSKPKNYSLPFHKQVMACTRRQFLVMVGDKQSLLGKWVGLVFQAIIVGSLFFNLPSTSAGVFTRGGVIFFILLFNALLALAELTAAFESRPILLKHKSFSFYRPAAYAIAQTVVDVPLVFIQVILFDIVVYFMANLQRTASQFFISVLVLWLITMTMYALFRAVGALCGSLDAATRVTGVLVQALIVYTGYLIPPQKMHPWFSWLRWINPVQYGFEALMSNEFYNLEILCDAPYLVPQVPGAAIANQGCAIQGSRPGTNIVQGSDYISVAFQYSRSHLWRNVGFICAFFIFFVFLTAVGMEIQKPNKGGGAVTIYKRGQTPQSVKAALDEKKPAEDEESGQSKNGGVTSPEDSTENEDSGNEAEGIVVTDAMFTWQDVNYTIPVQKGHKKLLNNVQGYVKPGALTALMGASGAGKTTLLNALAQRLRTGVVEGEFNVDGEPLSKSFQRSTGFAEQEDIHEPTQTVREALRFSAKLRQPKNVPIKEKYDYCEKIIDLLEMRHLAGAVIGTQGAGLNQEQRKLLTIGVELASKPELLLFLDEPTSGLDSGSAFNIVRLLKKLAAAGQPILCTIHQPSSVLFEHFDQLLLLKSGGRTVYFGPLGHDSRTLIDYLENNGGRNCDPAENPAEYMLEVIGAGDPNYKGKDWGDVWAQSEECKSLTKEIEKLISDRKGGQSNGAKKMDNRQYASSMLTQIITTVHRNFVSFWRSTEYTIGMFMLHIFTGLFNSFTFWHLGNSQIDMQSRLFSVFMTLTISPPLIQQLQPRFLRSRNLFESREGNAKIYSWFAFCWSAIVPEIPYRIVAGTIYWACWYWPTWFPRDTYTAASVWVMVVSFELFYLGFGQAIAAFSPNELLASLLVPIFFTFIVSFCGVVVPAMALPTFWRSWMYWLTPFHYLLEAMLGLIVDGVPVRCERSEMATFSAPGGQTCESYAGPFIEQAGGYVETLSDGLCGICQFANGNEFAASFSIYVSNIWRDYGIFWIYIFFNFAVVFACSWLYLEGGNKLKSMISSSKMKKSKGKKSQAGDEKV